MKINVWFTLIMTGAEVVRGMMPGLVETRRALEARGITPTLGIMRVGKKSSPDGAGATSPHEAYERMAVKRCEEVGVAVRRLKVDPDSDVVSAWREFERDSAIHGALLLRPLPKALAAAEREICLTADPSKDVDCMTPANLGRLLRGDGVFSPCTAGAVMELLQHYLPIAPPSGMTLAGKRVVIVGRSMVVGRPLAMMMTAADATVTLCHSRTEGLEAICREADVLVAAVGRPGMITASFVKGRKPPKEGAVVVDVGINVGPSGTVLGDVDFKAASGKASMITPVPGGVGVVTTMMLVKHTLIAAGG
ncbi:MAG: bifunctional 5,10-methylenetetrahydrofolate dehydrogenase/5,10-methenyltetrahydrofolate cyclohydrolase [Synergistaceae bacterium]|jgi:methylenetetrahydrofolate dehydrogenase (NADP+)/methenyltetrahydrofolate cyclohydrolase|nr:bifunctional 5,10-methylenetetrahydrofolate dehydrogenase/5,10-methenyltetrahydrofolate cyclohydrolase [Synergistaceae bacterium]